MRMIRMSTAVAALAAVTALAGCGGAARVNETAPTVSYRVLGNDVSEANARAMNYCQRYGHGARMLSYSGNTATYECSGTATAAVPPMAPAPAPTYRAY